MVTGNLNRIDVYDTATAAWLPEPLDLGQPCKGTIRGACALLDGSLYVIGGYRLAKNPCLRRVDRRDLAESADGATGWQPVEQMLTARHECSAAVMDGLLYVVGGHDNRLERLASAERYDPRADAWRPIAPMWVTRSVAGCAVLDGRLYVVGGFGSQGKRLRSAEVYDPATNVWSLLPDMRVERERPAVAAHAGQLYVMGGGREECSVEVYRPSEGVWHVLAEPMKCWSAYPAVCLFEKRSTVARSRSIARSTTNLSVASK